jgi:oligoribonuclease (3'-5' exoribonuclease)
LPDFLVWIDVETTGLKVRPDNPVFGGGDTLLEVAIVLTNAGFEEIGRMSTFVGEFGVSTPTEADVIDLRDRATPEVARMHDKSGLWRDLIGKTLPPIDQVDAALLSWVRVMGVDDDRKVALAGSGAASFDRQWIEDRFRAFAARLEYWTLDVGCVRRFFRYAGMDRHMPREEEGDHRAMSDVLAHVAEARRYRDLLGHAFGWNDPLTEASSWTFRHGRCPKCGAPFDQHDEGGIAPDSCVNHHRIADVGVIQ